MRRNVAVTLLLQGVKYGTNLAALVVLARLLRPYDYGLVAEATVIVGLAAVVGDLGLSLAALQVPTLTQAQRTALFWVNGLLGVVTGLVIAALAPTLAAFYGQPRLLPIVLALASVFVFSGFAVQFKVDVNRAGRFWSLGLIDVVGGLAGLGVAIAVAVCGIGYWALVAQQLVAAVVSLALAMWYSRWLPGWPRRGAELGGLLRFGRDTFAVQVANYVTANLDSVLVGRLFGTSILGLYNRAFQVVVLPLNQVLAPLTRVVLPKLAPIDSDEILNAALIRIQLVLTYVMLAPLSFLAATCAPLFFVVLGPQWAAAAQFVQILVIGAVFQSLGYVYYWAFLARGRTMLLFVSEMWGRVPMVISMLLLAHLGPIWVASSVAMGQLAIFLAGSTYYAARIGVDVRPLLAVATRPTLLLLSAAGAGIVADELLRAKLSEGALLAVLAGTWLVAVGLGLALSGQCRRDLRAVLSAIASRRRPAEPITENPGVQI